MQERVDSISQLFLTVFLKTVLEHWGQIHWLFASQLLLYPIYNYIEKQKKEGSRLPSNSYLLHPEPLLTVQCTMCLLGCKTCTVYIYFTSTGTIPFLKVKTKWLAAPWSRRAYIGVVLYSEAHPGNIKSHKRAMRLSLGLWRLLMQH
jgi:hypothetical protein